MKKLLLSMVLGLGFANALPAATVLFDLIGKGGTGLLATNENGAVTNGGTGGEIGAGISLDDVSRILTVNVGWGSLNGFTNLSSAANNSHIHGPTTSGGTASYTQDAGVLFTLPRVSSTADGGSISTSVTLSAAQVTELMAGRYYINVHTVNNGGGEIRGNLVAVPEPSRTLLVFGGLGVIGWRRRRSS